MHAKPDLRVFLKWMIAGSGSVIADVIRLNKMRFPTRTLFTATACAAIVLKLCVEITRARNLEALDVGVFWGGFLLDITFIAVVNVCMIMFFASLPRSSRSTVYNRYWLLLAAIAIVTPFIIGLNVVIGIWGATDNRKFFRVADSFNEVFTYGVQHADWMTICGSLVIPFALGIATIWCCRRLSLIVSDAPKAAV